MPRIVIRSLCTRYAAMNIDDKKQFLLILARDLHLDTDSVRHRPNPRIFCAC